LPRGECLVLEAIAAERMPHRMVVWGVPRARVYELRDYGAAGTAVVEALGRRGLRGVLWEDGRVLFGFESLGAREKVWREVSLDAEWVGLRVELRGVSVFQMANGVVADAPRTSVETSLDAARMSAYAT
jgi:hypothetical protein